MTELQYRELGRNLRHLVAEEVKRNKFQNLKCPNTKSKSLPFEEMKYRVNIIPRPKCQIGNGIRNLYVGDDEISVCVAGTFNNSENYSEGIMPKLSESPFRVVLGRYLAFPRFQDALEFSLKEECGTLSLFIIYGLYEEFVGEILPIIDQNIELFKTLIHDSSYLDLNNTEFYNANLNNTEIGNLPQYQTL